MIHRMRCIAGPNGSGKSTLFTHIQNGFNVDFYTFVNADEINAQLVGAAVCYFPFLLQKRSFKAYIQHSAFPADWQTLFAWERITVKGNKATFAQQDLEGGKSELISMLLADFIRETLIAKRQSFSFESVFSHPSKIETFKRAQESGFKNYLYFIATDDPQLNCQRVKNRVLHGGHNVPAQRIIDRYERCLGNIAATLPYLSRGYFFDSSEEMKLIAEYDSTRRELALQVPIAEIPQWFHRHILQTKFVRE